ncbi:MAG: Jag N-terminal domain-containing protein [Armatimonadetes bacterium]|nr:Jag N-terminal domain-containing protein [Anaerolineae bacterium]
MNDRGTVEVTAESVTEAVKKGCAQLGVTPLDVIVEILEEPSRGILGIGARPAKVRLQLLRRPSPPPPPPTPVVAAPPVVESEPAPAPKPLPAAPTPKPQPKPTPPPPKPPVANREPKAPTPKASAKPADDYEYNDDDEAYAFSDLQGDATGEEGDISKAVLLELLAHIPLEAQVEVTRAAAQPGENPPYLLNIEGGNVSALIGRRGETLAALQYITRLIASRRLNRRANIVLDVDSYKARRSQKLRDLALRMAQQAVQEARIITLEPMPPHERRMIHLALRNHAEVSTKSTGEGDDRKVTIVPK